MKAFILVSADMCVINGPLFKDSIIASVIRELRAHQIRELFAEFPEMSKYCLKTSQKLSKASKNPRNFQEFPKALEHSQKFLEILNSISFHYVQHQSLTLTVMVFSRMEFELPATNANRTPKQLELLKYRQVDKRSNQKDVILLKNTSAFDSIVHSLASLYASSADFRAEIDEIISEQHETEHLRFVVASVERGVTEENSRWRTDILTATYPNALRNIKTVECNDDILQVLTRFITYFPPTAMESRRCAKNCKAGEVKENRCLEIKATYRNGVLKLQEALDEMFSDDLKNETNCMDCGKKCEVNFEFPKIVFIHVGLKDSMQRSGIPEEIRLKNRHYALGSTIDERSKGYFVANSVRNGTIACYLVYFD